MKALVDDVIDGMLQGVLQNLEAGEPPRADVVRALALQLIKDRERLAALSRAPEAGEEGDVLAHRVYRHLTNYAEACAARRENIEQVRDQAFAALSTRSCSEPVAGLTVTLVETTPQLPAHGSMAIRKWDNHGLPAGTHRLYASPQPARMPTREEVARIIDPHAIRFFEQGGYDYQIKMARDAALAKAGAILALHPTETATPSRGEG